MRPDDCVRGAKPLVQLLPKAEFHALFQMFKAFFEVKRN